MLSKKKRKRKTHFKITILLEIIGFWWVAGQLISGDYTNLVSGGGGGSVAESGYSAGLVIRRP